MVEVAARFRSSEAVIVRPSSQAGAAERRLDFDLHAGGVFQNQQLARTNCLDSLQSLELARRRARGLVLISLPAVRAPSPSS